MTKRKEKILMKIMRILIKKIKRLGRKEKDQNMKLKLNVKIQIKMSNLKSQISNIKWQLLLCCLLISGTAFAKDQPIAYIDMAYILKNLAQYEQANEQLTMLSKRWQKEIDAAQQEARVMATNYQTEQIFLSENMRTQREQEIVKKEQEVLELKRKYFGQDGELYKKREALIKPIQDEIYTAIQDVASEKRIDIVKDRSADPALIYMSSKLDISDQVLQKLGAK